MDTVGIYTPKGRWNDKGIIKMILAIIEIIKCFLNIIFILKNGIMNSIEITCNNNSADINKQII